MLENAARDINFQKSQRKFVAQEVDDLKANAQKEKDNNANNGVV